MNPGYLFAAGAFGCAVLFALLSIVYDEGYASARRGAPSDAHWWMAYVLCVLALLGAALTTIGIAVRA